MNFESEKIVVLDCKGESEQVTNVLKMIRRHKVFSEIAYCDITPGELAEKKPKGIVIAGDSNISAKIAFDLGVPVFDAREMPEEAINIALEKFLKEDAGCLGNFTVEAFINDITAHIKEVIGDKRALCALSGGVDSSVSAVIVNKAIGDKLTCIFVDTGLMRHKEGDEVIEAYRDKLNMNVIRVDAEKRFLDKLKGVLDPEKKRKIIGEEFIRVFEEEAKKLGQIEYLVQGTIYPDIIESGTKNKALVKSHHNVGGLPENIGFDAIIEPVRELFKDEVREVGAALGIPENLVKRQPFPGPGLGVRVIGEITKEKLDVLRIADYIFRDEIYKAGLSSSIWQYFAIYTGVSSVGVKNDARTYGHVIALRAVNSIDAMSAECVDLPYSVLEAASKRIVSEIPEVSRVVYDITSKPPATIEWE